MAEAVTRPNGKTYRPRKPPEVKEFTQYDGREGVAVMRTHDLDQARELARPFWESYYDPGTMPEGERVWWRLVPWDPSGEFDWTYMDDPAHGSAAVVFLPDGL